MTYENSQNDIDAFASMIRDGLPAMIDAQTDGAIQQVGDREMVAWEGVEQIFQIELSNGAEFQFTLRQVKPAEEMQFECEGCGELFEKEQLDRNNGKCVDCLTDDEFAVYMKRGNA